MNFSSYTGPSTLCARPAPLFALGVLGVLGDFDLENGLLLEEALRCCVISGDNKERDGDAEPSLGVGDRPLCVSGVKLCAEVVYDAVASALGPVRMGRAESLGRGPVGAPGTPGAEVEAKEASDARGPVGMGLCSFAGGCPRGVSSAVRLLALDCQQMTSSSVRKGAHDIVAWTAWYFALLSSS